MLFLPYFIFSSVIYDLIKNSLSIYNLYHELYRMAAFLFIILLEFIIIIHVVLVYIFMMFKMIMANFIRIIFNVSK